ncbi:hypothetical protein [Trujillonella endophytica]|uniref:hypothetical protein n=1 Tax=Trujillonella endophytica TaxID=673521 RepID=UPI00147E15D5|nr:hypothetical protein [Trujillella endophytica]
MTPEPADSPDRERRLVALDVFIAEFEAAHGAITTDEMNTAAGHLRDRAPDPRT